MHTADLDFDLPQKLIAQRPAEQREASRMLVVDRRAETYSNWQFKDLPALLRSDDLLVVNNTRVFPARLLGKTETGAHIEIFLIRETGEDKWEALAKPGRRLRVGKRIIFTPELSAVVASKNESGPVEISFEHRGCLADLVDTIGRTPLPPYIKRDATSVDTDCDRYQTVYAKNRGAIAAPTAGLHFTPAILSEIAERGIEMAEITLHVGYGTFEPIRRDDLAEHTVMPEDYQIDPVTAEKLNRAKVENRRIVAVGTTTVRALESNISAHSRFQAVREAAALTITPGYEFKAVGALLTNFHLPQSSLLLLTSTFGGHDLIMNAYRSAVAEQYRFYSYGDCMFIS